jgi:thiol-disulfide isomerase/thioredoxin
MSSLVDSVALSETSDKEILVVFTADWCKYCSIMKQDISKTPKVVDDKIVCYVDYDTNTDLVKEYKVKLIPDYFILKKRIETKRRVGYTNLGNFIQWLRDE